MLVFGVVGYVLKKCDYPLAPLVLAIVLGDKAEEILPAVAAGLAGQPRRSSCRTALVGTIMALGLIALFWPVISTGWSSFAPRPRHE